jgi:hypothetical protein
MEARKKILLTVVIVSVVAVLTAAGIYIKRQYDKVMNYCYKVIGVKVWDFTINKVRFDLRVLLSNASDFELTLNGYDFNVLFNGVFITRIVSTDQQFIAANDKSEITISVDFEPKKLFAAGAGNILSLIVAALVDRKNFKMSFQGNLAFKMGIVRIDKLPVTYDMTLEEAMTDSAPERQEYCKNQLN